MEVLTLLFYLFTILPLFWELNAFDDAEDVSKLYASINGPTWEDERGCIVPLMVSYIIWNLVGLFTSQWPLFLLLILLSLIPIKNTAKGMRIDAALSIVVLVCIILNKVHWKVDLGQWLTSLL
jgi:hypothetical protein